MTIDVLRDSLEEFYGIDALEPEAFRIKCLNLRGRFTRVSPCKRDLGHGGDCWGTGPSGNTYRWRMD